MLRSSVEDRPTDLLDELTRNSAGIYAIDPGRPYDIFYNNVFNYYISTGSSSASTPEPRGTLGKREGADVAAWQRGVSPVHQFVAGDVVFIVIRGGMAPTVDTSGSKKNRIVVFLDTLYLLSSSGKHRRGSDLVFDFFEDKFEEGDFESCNYALKMMDERKISSIILVAVLAVTFPVRDKLRDRSDFYHRAKNALASGRGEGDANDLLEKYR